MGTLHLIGDFPPGSQGGPPRGGTQEQRHRRRLLPWWRGRARHRACRVHHYRHGARAGHVMGNLLGQDRHVLLSLARTAMAHRRDLGPRRGQQGRGGIVNQQRVNGHGLHGGKRSQHDQQDERVAQGQAPAQGQPLAPATQPLALREHGHVPPGLSADAAPCRILRYPFMT